MSSCSSLIRLSIRTANKRYGILNKKCSLFFEGLRKIENRNLHLFTKIPITIFGLISTLTIIISTKPLLILPFNPHLSSINNKSHGCIMFKIKSYIDKFDMHFASRHIKISIAQNKYTFNKSTHKIRAYSGKKWINNNDQEWIKMYIHLGIYLFIYIH